MSAGGPSDKMICSTSCLNSAQQPYALPQPLHRTGAVSDSSSGSITETLPHRSQENWEISATPSMCTSLTARD
jgi:hypothetical protein